MLRNTRQAGGYSMWVGQWTFKTRVLTLTRYFFWKFMRIEMLKVNHTKNLKNSTNQVLFVNIRYPKYFPLLMIPVQFSSFHKPYKELCTEQSLKLGL